MKILFLPSWYPHRYNFTAGIFVQRHAECVAQHTTNKVAVLYVFNKQDADRIDFEVVDAIINEVSTFTVYYHPVKFYFPLLTQIQRYLKWKKAYAIGWNHLHKKFGMPDGLHVQVILKAGIIALQLKKKFHLPFIITEHWSGYDRKVGTYKSWFQKYFTKKIVKDAEVIAPINQNIIHHMLNHNLKAEYTVVTNVVDTDLFKPIVHQNKVCRFVHVSNFKSEKNTVGILHAIKKLSLIRNDFEVIIAGGRTYFEETKQVYDSLKFDGQQVKLVGKLLPTEVSNLIANGDVFLLFSHYEGLPCSIVEAWACGIPVLSSDVGGISEYLDESNGRLVTAGNENELVQAMSWMIDNHK